MITIVQNNMKSALCLSLIIAMICPSCGNRPKVKHAEPEEPAPQAVEIKEKLDTNLVRGVLRLVRSKEHLRHPEMPLSESFIAMFFVVDTLRRKLYFSDSTVRITYNVYGTGAHERFNYRGMLNLDTIRVAIFDMGNFAENYYNKDSVEYVPLDDAKPYRMGMVLTQSYYVKDGELKYWNP